MDRNDPNTWTKDFVLANREACLDFLKEDNLQVVDYVRHENYIVAIAGLDRIQNGLVTMNNAKCGDFRSHLAMFSMCEGLIIAFGVSDSFAYEEKRRELALKSFEDARDFAKSTDMKAFVGTIIADLKSGAPLSKLKEEYGDDFSQHVTETLIDLNDRLSSAGAAGPKSGNGKSAGGQLFWIIAVVVVFILCIRSCSNSGRSASSTSDNTVQNEISADKTPDSAEGGQEYEDGGFVFPNSGTELIERREAENLSDRDLTYAINEIYARHGYIFQSDEMRGYYEQFSWYTGRIPSAEFSVECFNQIEQQNWNLLINERNRRKASG